ncbi:MAG: hypothetical protein NTW21_18305 [Verrucomicrobia bacterium]|nr:hypothetical protein [Verrucomicrobiota bacterium]
MGGNGESYGTGRVFMGGPRRHRFLQRQLLPQSLVFGQRVDGHLHKSICIAHTSQFLIPEENELALFGVSDEFVNHPRMGFPGGISADAVSCLALT